MPAGRHRLPEALAKPELAREDGVMADKNGDEEQDDEAQPRPASSRSGGRRENHRTDDTSPRPAAGSGAPSRRGAASYPRRKNFFKPGVTSFARPRYTNAPIMQIVTIRLKSKWSQMRSKIWPRMPGAGSIPVVMCW